MKYNTSTGKLYLLFSACVPENEHVKNRLFFDALPETEDYKKLSSTNQGRSILQEILRERVGIELPTTYRTRVEASLSLANTYLLELNKAYSGKDWSGLKPEDKPAFNDQSSIERAIRILQNLPSGRCVTNISIENVQDLYDSNVIHDPMAFLEDLEPNELENVENAIEELEIEVPYCFSVSKLNEKVKEMQAMLHQCYLQQQVFRRHVHHRRVTKWCLLFAFIASIPCIYLFGFMPNFELITYSLVGSFVTFLMMIVG